jgi:hypothetical protein
MPQDSPSSRGGETTVTSQPIHSWLVRPRKHFLYSPSCSSFQPLEWQFPGKIVWFGDYFSPPCSLLSCSRLNWHDISVLFQRTSNKEPTFWRTWKLFCAEYKNTSSPLQLNQPGKFPLRTTSTIIWEGIPLFGCKMLHSGNEGLLFQASVFLISTKYANAHTAWQEPQSDHMNSLPVDKDITSLWSEKYTSTHRLKPRNA